MPADDHTAPQWEESPFMRAARGQPTPYVPVWLMRQAGRYMPEYRAIRQKVSFLELCHDPGLCAEVALMAVNRLGVDAAILFSDLLVLLEAMGLEVQFGVGDGPVVGPAIREAADVDRLAELDDAGSLEFVMQAVRETRAALPESLPLLGFAGAPFTLASYAVEGGASHTYRRTKTFMVSDPGAWNALLGRIARAAAVYLRGQIAAGAQAVQLFDSWVGCLGPDDYRQYVLPHTRAVIEALPAGVPVIHFATGNPALLPLMAEAGGTVIGVDWRVRLDDAWRTVGYDRAVQGNLDPTALLGDRASLRRKVQEILAQASDRPGHIFNLGHGVLPETPVENAVALVDFVHEARH
jgi:uroporphyrinogen decarboxylase